MLLSSVVSLRITSRSLTHFASLVHCLARCWQAKLTLHRRIASADFASSNSRGCAVCFYSAAGQTEILAFLLNPNEPPPQVYTGNPCRSAAHKNIHTVSPGFVRRSTNSIPHPKGFGHGCAFFSSSSGVIVARNTSTICQPHLPNQHRSQLLNPTAHRPIEAGLCQAITCHVGFGHICRLLILQLIATTAGNIAAFLVPQTMSRTNRHNYRCRRRLPYANPTPHTAGLLSRHQPC